MNCDACNVPMNKVCAIPDNDNFKGAINYQPSLLLQCIVCKTVIVVKPKSGKAPDPVVDPNE